jgi:hypothetical protein
MIFRCKELSISDEELGCTITFSDSRSADDQFKTVGELMNSEKKYLLIQRTYPEDDFDQDYYHIESSESDLELNPQDKIIVRISREKFEIQWSGDHLEIGLNLSDKQLMNLEKVFKRAFGKRITIEP